MATLKDLIVLGKSKMTDKVYAPEYYEGGVSLIDKYLTSASTYMGNYVTTESLETSINSLSGSYVTTGDLAQSVTGEKKFQQLKVYSGTTGECLIHYDNTDNSINFIFN